ncbi:PCNA-associated factor [Dissostichus eleginoides]|uniref:PCNA-associated factor n=1 Tax=Dissostichus eleginoides TaxID=100907 RepID=A0AAD9B1J3_DISEL|nr:PCNA-associated factor [Dissostichus eleginoides]
MVRTKADSVPQPTGKLSQRRHPGSLLERVLQTSRQAAARRRPRSDLTHTHTRYKGIGDFFGGPPRKPEEEKNLKPEKENLKPEKENLKPVEVDDGEAGGSGVSKASRKSRPLPADDEEEED